MLSVVRIMELSEFQRIAPGDVDGDGLDDLVLTNREETIVMRALCQAPRPLPSALSGEPGEPGEPSVSQRLVRAMARLGLAVALLSVAPPAALAQAPPDLAKAKTLFKAGAQAYGDNDFKAALHAFEAARAIVPDAALTFSIAQAHRRQYRLERGPRHLRLAVLEYQRYLSEVPKGGRRGDAAEALLELEPKLQQSPQQEQPAEAPSRKATRLMCCPPSLAPR